MAEPRDTRPAGIRTGVRRLFRLEPRTQASVEAEVNDELGAFLNERVDHLVARGMSPADARAEALRRLGTPLDEARTLLNQSAGERDRRRRARESLDDLTQDVRYAMRTLRRDAAFAVSAILIIALGIAASVTVFSVANALLIRPLPFRDPGSLVWMPNGRTGGLSGETSQVDHFLDLRRENKSFEELAAYFAFYGVGDTKLSLHDDAVRLSTVPVTQNFFPMLGVHPILGRTFNDAESVQDGPKAVLLSHALWVRQFASDPRIVGKAITLNEQPVTVIGVLPATFDFASVFAPGAHIDLFSALPLGDEMNREGNTLSIVGRLRSGVSVAGAKAELGVIAPQLTAAHPERNAFNPILGSLRDHVTGHLRSALTVLAFAVVVVMLIVCANLSNLLLARATTRYKEVAIRAALGAGRARLVRQMLTESVLLSACGSVLGLIIAALATRAISHMDSVSLPLLVDVRIDATAVAFTAALAMLAGLAFGLAPALQLREVALHEALRASGRSATDGKRGQRLRKMLVVSEIALACMLVVGSGLLIHSFLRLLDVDLGFRPERVASVRVDPDQQWVSSSSRFIAYTDEVLRLARDVRGVESAAIADGLPLGSNRSWGVRAKGHVYEKGHSPVAFVRMVSDGYIDAMGMQLLEGRDFTARDDSAAPPVIIINRTMARALWPGENALGKFALLNGNDALVVGIVGDVRHLALDADAGREMYLPIRQVQDFSTVDLVVRSTLPPAALGKTMRAALASVAPNLPLNGLQTLTQIVDRAVSPRRFFTMLLAGFALFALALALFGIYGVISYTVNHRTQEIGVRIALGASRRNVQGQIIRETLDLAAIGIVLGTVGSWMLARALRGLLFGVTSTDAVTFIGMIAIVTLVAALSGYLPARRASRIDPIVAFRSS
jgi:putative ABC transport system permease protein